MRRQSRSATSPRPETLQEQPTLLGQPRTPCTSLRVFCAAGSSARQRPPTTGQRVSLTVGSPAAPRRARRCAGPRGLLSAAAYAGHDRTLAQAALITRLAGLAQAVSELRLAQARHAQAAAARSAAMYLRGGDSSGAESLVAGQVRTEPGNLARDGFPAPPRPAWTAHPSQAARDGRPPGRQPRPTVRRPRGPGR